MLLTRLYDFWSKHGTYALLGLLSNKFLELSGISTLLRQNATGKISGNNVKETGPLRIYHAHECSRRVTLVIHNENNSLSWERLTAEVLLAVTLADRWDCDLRVLVLDNRHIANNFNRILKQGDYTFPKNVEFIQAGKLRQGEGIDAGVGDVFITTSYPGIDAIIGSVNEKKLIYLVEEDEGQAGLPVNYDRQYAEIFRNEKIHFVFNSCTLYDNLVSQGFDYIKNTGILIDQSSAGIVDSVEKLSHRLSG